MVVARNVRSVVKTVTLGWVDFAQAKQVKCFDVRDVGHLIKNLAEEVHERVNAKVETK
jgi:hypothetical protein